MDHSNSILFNPFCTNGFLLLVCYNKLGIVYCISRGVSGYNSQMKLYYFLRGSFFVLANDVHVDPDEMPHDAAFHLGLHCFRMYLFKILTHLAYRANGNKL